MRRIVSLCLAAALALSLAVGARAAAAAELERAFVYGDTLYTYVDITGADQPITKADAEIDGRTFPASGTLETVRQAGFPVTWLLLVDNSNSMPPFREEVTAFAQELAAACGENTRFSLASFGDQFTLLEEDAAAEQLSEAMAEIPMDETVTRLHSSIDAALDYFDGLPRSGSELRCLVVLSDAVQYDPNAAVSHGELLERINSSGVLVHSVGFGTDAEALESLAALTEASGGIHQVVGDSLTAADAAAALAEDAGALYVTGFSLAGFTPAEETAQVSVTFASGGELLCRGTAEVEFPTGEASEEVPEEPAEEPLPPPAEEAVPVGGTAPDSGEAAPASGGVPLPLLLGGAAALVIAAAVLLLLARKRRGPAPAPAAEPAAEEGIFLRLEVLRGDYIGGTTEFTLVRELVIGREEDCGIPFADASVSRRNSRVFLAGGAVYIEDLSSQNGTCVNGERISMARQLRSGDEISAGDVSFRLKF